MKKILFYTATCIAFLALLATASNTAKASTNEYITLTNSKNSWTLVEGTTTTLQMDVHPTNAKITNLYLFLDNKLISRCQGKVHCSYTLTVPKIGKHTLYVYALDSQNHFYFVNGKMDFYQNLVSIAKDNTIPTITLTQKGTAYTETTSTNGIYIQAIARGTNLDTIKIIQTDSTGKTMTNSCANMRSVCSIGIYPTFSADQAGKTYTYKAVITDAAGHSVVSELLTVHVLAKTNQNTVTPVASHSLQPTLGTTPTTLGVNQSSTVNGTATNANGVWGVEVRALPSWSNTAITKRCILANKPTTGSCSMNIGSFAGHIGQSVKVWVIYWDAKTGLGYSSEMRTITLTK